MAPPGSHGGIQVDQKALVFTRNGFAAKNLPFDGVGSRLQRFYPSAGAESPRHPELLARKLPKYVPGSAEQSGDQHPQHESTAKHGASLLCRTQKTLRHPAGADLTLLAVRGLFDNPHPIVLVFQFTNHDAVRQP